MKCRFLGFLLAIIMVGVACSGCGIKYMEKVKFPSPDDLFITTGDGDIQKPYTPVGQMILVEKGWRIPLPLFGLIPVDDVYPDSVLKEKVYDEVTRMGGDGVINLRISWTPPKNGFLGMFAEGGSLAMYGTVIKR